MQILPNKNIQFSLLFQESLLREDKEEEGCSDIKESAWEKGEGRLRSAWEKGEGGWLVRKKWESRKWRKSLQWRWWRKKSEIDHSSNKDDLVLCFDIELKVKTTEKSQMKSDWYLIQTNMTSWPKANPGAQSFKLKVPTRIQRYATQKIHCCDVEREVGNVAVIWITWTGVPQLVLWQADKLRCGLVQTGVSSFRLHL